MKSFILTLGVFLTTVCFLHRASAEVYTVDSVHSSVDFEIGHMGISEITGRFREYSGVLNFNPEAIHEMTLSATLEIESIDTANQARDEHLQQNDYFDTAKFPHITFVSKKVEKSGDKEDEDEKEYIITGELTMHGVAREVQMEFEYNGATKNSKGQDVIGFELEGGVDRLDFGIGDDKKHTNGELFLGAEVEFEIHAEAIKVE